MWFVTAIVVNGYTGPFVPFSTDPNDGDGAFSLAATIDLSAILIGLLPLPNVLYGIQWNLRVTTEWPTTAGRQFWQGVARNFYPSGRLQFTQGGAALGVPEEVKVESYRSPARAVAYDGVSVNSAYSRLSAIPKAQVFAFVGVSPPGPVTGSSSGFETVYPFVLPLDQFADGADYYVLPGCSGTLQLTADVFTAATVSDSLLIYTR